MALNNYRRLTMDELQPLEKEFVEFLVVNGITAEDWVALKEENPDKGDEMIDLFSEVIFEGIFRKVKFLKMSTPHFIYAYQCLNNKMVLVGVECNDDTVDLTRIALNDAVQKAPSSISLFMTEKNYGKKREHELYEMTTQGCEISDGELFKSLSLAYIENQHG